MHLIHQMEPAFWAQLVGWMISSYFLTRSSSNQLTLPKCGFPGWPEGPGGWVPWRVLEGAGKIFEDPVIPPLPSFCLQTEPWRWRGAGRRWEKIWWFCRMDNLARSGWSGHVCLQSLLPGRTWMSLAPQVLHVPLQCLQFISYISVGKLIADQGWTGKGQRDLLSKANTREQKLRTKQFSGLRTQNWFRPFSNSSGVQRRCLEVLNICNAYSDLEQSMQ